MLNGRQTGIAMLLLVAQLACGETSEVDDGKRLVDEFVDDIITFQGRFEQALIDANGEVVEKTNGMLEIQRPGQFRWSY
ncbi:MAG: hypothetical protein GQ528_06270, partial [Woeseiaceae bacterium]|nr:hypothetical protein [Woeseiaceae bacterium]